MMALFCCLSSLQGSKVLLNNQGHARVIDALLEALNRSTSASLLTHEFSLFAWDALFLRLQGLQHVRLLLSHPSDDTQAIPLNLLGHLHERRFRNSLSTQRIARTMERWLNQTSVEVRLSPNRTGQSLFLTKREDGGLSAISGSSPLTGPGLGLTPSDRVEMNTSVEDSTQAKPYLDFFDSLWAGPKNQDDVKVQLQSQLKNLYLPKAPETLYFQTLKHLFGSNVEELDEERIVRTRTGIRDTLVWKKLYRFQRDGVIGAVDKLERYNGCIIADSVGLGKTFEALAIIKYYELRNDRVLVLAPKRLRDNWTLYTINDKRNLFASDRFNFDVLNHTDLSRVQGFSGEINLASLNWGNYDLVVIDESHNFRNNPPKRDGLTRYGRLMRDIIQAGVRTKVLLLSATPVNNRMNDLKNQVAFITEGKDDALVAVGLPSIELTLRKAQTLFNQWLKTPNEARTTQGLLDALNFDYFQLLDLLTIARSRKHIAKYYDLKEVGPFPRRETPVNLKPDIDSAGKFPPLVEVNHTIKRLNLSAYAPLSYVLPHKVQAYSRLYDLKMKGGRSFKQIDREASLIHLMRVNLLKRMESSINSFAQTIGKLLGKVRALLERISDHEEGDLHELSIEEVDLASDEMVPFLVGTKVKVLLQDVDRVRWRQDLEEDESILLALQADAQMVDSTRDLKLHRLKELISTKVNSPINAGNKKVIVFTAFADTADYLYTNLATWALKELGVFSAVVTGRKSSNKTTLKGMRTDLSTVLTTFSPVSKERGVVDPQATQEIDLLIATDCISEGQNLQDCDFLVNFDIHWNPVRIIQRFGRVDRLGSKNSVIQLVNFWPNMALDEYINLEARVSGRMVLLDISATGEENVIQSSKADEMNDLDYRRRQLEQIQREAPDIEDLSNGISITDLTLNDFRMDLTHFLKEKGVAIDPLPLGSFATLRMEDLDPEDGLHPGAFFCLRCDSPDFRHGEAYPLAPHYLVYVGEDGVTQLNFHQVRRVLDLMKRVTLGRTEADPKATAAYEHTTSRGQRMETYQHLLAEAVTALRGKSEEYGVGSLFERSGTHLTRDSFRGMEEIEVVSWLVILGDRADHEN